MLPEIMGYRRPDGRFGIRNHIAVIATMDNANPTVRRICSLVKGCVPFCPGADNRLLPFVFYFS